jgi:hypothetical protein
MGNSEQMQEQIINVTMVLLLNQIISRGMIEIIGVIWRRIRKGDSDFSSFLFQKSKIERTDPKKAERKIAHNVMPIVTQEA